MKSRLSCFCALASLVAFTAANGLAGTAARTVDLWPKGIPGDNAATGEERDTTKPTDKLIAGKVIIKLANVSKPTITVYRPPANLDTGAAVVVCPGGGYSILAWDLEGTEVCDWLNSIGVTGVLLKYRVPKPAGQNKPDGPLYDVQRALGLTRQNAKEWGLDPKRIGVLGFSAGGHLAAAASNNFDGRKYPKVDEADAVSCRPDFAVLIYPAYLTVKPKEGTKEEEKLSPDMNITANTPPTFLSIAQDDPVRVEGVLHYGIALRSAKVPYELHVYPSGGHGYGLRRTKEFVTTWPDRVADWMKSQGLLEKK